MIFEKSTWKTKLKKKSILFLRLANYLLLAVSWIEAFYAYPRLPQEIPLWLNFFGQEILKSKKSPYFFIYPLAQTLFILAFLFLIKAMPFKRSQSKNILASPSGEKSDRILDLKKEFILLSLIFFNLIFIHLQTSLILLSHQIGQGVNKSYFFSLFVVLLVLIPYYRARQKLLLKKTHFSSND